MSHDGVGLRAVMRSVAFLTAGTLAVSTLAGCSSGEEVSKPLVGQDIAPAGRAAIADGGTLRWAVDDLPETLNTFQSDADATTTRVAEAVLPAMYRLDAAGRPQRDADFLESAKVVDTEPKQVVLYKLSQQAVWSDGREIGAADFAAQWRALSGRDNAYWTARNAGYERIEKVERGANNLEVKVTFARPYADWRSLFSPLYPKDVMGTPDSFNDGARRKLKVTAGPFAVKKVDRKNDRIVLTRNPRWWGAPAKLSEIDLKVVPRDKRAAALAAGKLDLAEIDPSAAGQITAGAAGTSASPGPGAAAHKGASRGTGASPHSGPGGRHATTKAERRLKALRAFEVRKSLEPAFTQLALNGAEGPLADERVRRAVARALDRKALAEAVLKPLGLPAVPVGSHVALSGQAAYADNSGALGREDTAEAQALLSDAGWVPGGPVKANKKGEKGEEEESGEKGEKEESGESGESGEKEEDSGSAGAGGKKAGHESESAKADDGTYTVGEDDKAGRESDPAEGKSAGSTEDPKDHEHPAGDTARRLAQEGGQYRHPGQGSAPGAYAPEGTAAPGGTAVKALAKNGKPLVLRFVLPSGVGYGTLRAVADRISGMLARVGIRTETSKVSEASYFKDHIAAGDFDLALWSWPASAFPATDARPIYAKPVPAADGSLNVEQNYTRVGTDQVDQLFDEAVATLDEKERRGLLRKADSRIWAAAGSIPLFQRPQLTAARRGLVNAGAFGFQTPVFEDIGFLKKGGQVSPSPSHS